MKPKRSEITKRKRTAKARAGSLKRVVRRLDVKTDREELLYLTRGYWI